MPSSVDGLEIRRAALWLHAGLALQLVDALISLAAVPRLALRLSGLFRQNAEMLLLIAGHRPIHIGAPLALVLGRVRAPGLLGVGLALLIGHLALSVRHAVLHGNVLAESKPPAR
jgi:hypothetical protein